MLKHRPTPASELNPADIRYIGYWEGSFYVSEHDYVSFGDVLRDCADELTWIGAPGWFAYDCCRDIYEWLAARYDMVYWYPGEWMEIGALTVIEQQTAARAA